MKALRIGTRRSALATTQAGTVADALTAAGLDVQLVGITTEGDRNAAPLSQIGGTGVFVSALREQLLDGAIDLAVHSLKDLPTAPPVGLVLAAVPHREPPWDALVSRDGHGLADLPIGARIGTGSPRRAAQLRLLAGSWGRSWDIQPIRGNIDTRLRRLGDGEYDAIVLARAGLARLGRLDVVTEVLEASVMLPAPGQGALAVERAADADLGAEVLAALADLDDAATRAAVVAERVLLADLEAGCLAPVGAHAEVRDSVLHLEAIVAAEDGSAALRREASGSQADAAAVGSAIANELLAAGAADLMGDRPRARL